MNDTFSKKIIAILNSKKFFYIVLAFFIFEAAWIALSSHYPMAADEDFHFGIIKLYAHQLSPFFSHEPPGANIYGAVTRDPSYLYHYLMSFPYRWLSVFTHNQFTLVLWLRFMNIAFFASGIVLFRKLLLKAKISFALANIATLFFILIPSIPQLAAQINYDNLLLPLVAVSLLLTVDVINTIKNDHAIDSKTALLLVFVCCSTSLVKYAFSPIFFAIVLYVGVVLYKNKRYSGQMIKSIKKSFRQLSLALKLTLILLAVVSAGLFVERYGVNTIRYESPIPECDRVLSVKECTQYGPWNRNYIFRNAIKAEGRKANPNILTFTKGWVNDMITNLALDVNSYNGGYYASWPMPLPRFVMVAITLAVLVLAIVYSKQLWSAIKRNTALSLFVLVTLIYCAALLGQNYFDYLDIGEKVAIQGRYLLPIMLPLFIIIGLLFSYLVKNRPNIKALLTIVVLILMLEGGGLLTFVLRSDTTWWQSNKSVITANQKARKILKPFIFGS